jgi:uncharacterized protein YlxW (UPF0749 family)
MFKKPDYLILAIILFFFGIFVVSQYKAGKNYLKIIQPENNETLALEVATLTKSNSDLRNQTQKLTVDLNTYSNSSASKKVLYDQYTKDKANLDSINGLVARTGQGVSIKVEGKMTTAQVVDLVNAIKNIGSDFITINNTRLMLNTSLSQFSNQASCDILVYGNSELLKSAIERKGGIIDQVSSKDIKMSVEAKDSLTISKGDSITYKYSKIIIN